MKIFISMPMHGRSDEGIEICRDEIIAEVKEMFGIKDTIDSMSSLVADMATEKIFSGKTAEAVVNFSKDLIDARRIEVIDNFHKTIPDGLQNERVWCLGDSIKLMQDADLVVFAWNWGASRGCPVEMEVCKQYDIPYLVLSSHAFEENNSSYHYTHGVGCKHEPVLNDGILGRVDV